VARRHEGRTAVISGAAAGIGQAAAVRLAAEGARIVIADRNQAQETLQMIASSGGRAIAMQCDVSDPGSVEALKAEVEKSGGGCDILVNNAGIYPMQAFNKMTFAEWRHILSVNLDSMFLMTKAFVEGMQRREWGRMINLASDTVSLMVPALVHYITSKAGVIGFTRALATELGAHGITVNAIAPGLTRTPGTTAPRVLPDGRSGDELFGAILNMQTIKRTEEPTDLAGAISFLASEDAGFITGQTLYVNGGLTRTT